MLFSKIHPSSFLKKHLPQVRSGQKSVVFALLFKQLISLPMKYDNFFKKNLFTSVQIKFPNFRKGIVLQTHQSS